MSAVLKGLSLIVLLACSSLLLAGCLPSMTDKQESQDISEQLYIDSRLNFAIKHPLAWQRLQIPVSSTQYRADTVRWQVSDLPQKNHDAGEVLIRSLPANPKLGLQELLSSFMATQAELKTSQVEEISLASGPALKLLGHDNNHGFLTIVLKGQGRDFIISLKSPSSGFEELLPVFQDIASSFTEVVRPSERQK